MREQFEKMLRAEEKKRCFRGGTVEIEREVEGGVVHESSSCLRYSEVLPGVDKVSSRSSWQI
jgi:hypothetical protein